MLNLALVQIREALAQVPYIARINHQDDYERALTLMDELVDDYDTNKQLIELLATSIERWEAAFFKIVVAQSCFKQPLFAPARVSRAAPDLASRHR